MALVTLTAEQKAQAQAYTIMNLAGSLQTNIVATLNRIFASIFKNPDPTLTADLVITGFGVNAQSLLALYNSLAAIQNSIAANSVPTVPPANWAFTDNSDGSITAVYTAPTS